MEVALLVAHSDAVLVVALAVAQSVAAVTVEAAAMLYRW